MSSHVTFYLRVRRQSLAMTVHIPMCLVDLANSIHRFSKQSWLQYAPGICCIYSTSSGPSCKTLNVQESGFNKAGLA